jgi:ribosomal protein L40E
MRGSANTAGRLLTRRNEAMIKREFYVNMTLNEILNLAHTWLLSYGFKIEKEVVKSTKSVTVASSPAHHSITIWISGHARRCSVLLRGTDEVLLLITFLQSGGMPLQPQQQQQQQQQVITVNIPPIQYNTTPSTAPQPRPPSIPLADTFFCDSCGARVRVGAAFCKQCGAAVVAITPTGRKQEVSPPPELIFCSYCGAENAGDAEICRACGVSLRND